MTSENTQRFFSVLQQCDSTLVHEKNGILQCNAYEDNSKTLRLQYLCCKNLDENALDSFGVIRHITGTLELTKLACLTLNGLNNLESVQTLKIIANDHLLTINGCNGLQKIENLEIAYNHQLTSIYGFSQLFYGQNELPGYLKITNNKALTTILFLHGLRKVNSSLYLHHNALESLAGLDQLESVNASLSLSSNRLTSLAPLHQLHTVNGMLGVVNNNLTTLAGLEQLETIKTVKWNKKSRTLGLHGNKNLYDISSLAKVKNSDNYLIIDTDSFIQYLHKPALDTDFSKNILEIHDNSTKNIIPSYLFRNKQQHDYIHFRQATHNQALTHIFDFELATDTLVLSFSGFNGYLGGIFHNRYPYITDSVTTHKIFLYDKDNSWYHNGIPHLTRNMEETIQLIQYFVDLKKYKRTICIGASMGGYMALLVGKLIHATKVIAISPQTFLDSETRKIYHDERWKKQVNRLHKKNIAHDYLNLQKLYQENFNAEIDIEIHYASKLALDAIHAKHIDFGQVTLIPYDIDDHYLAIYLHKKGMLEDIIKQAVKENRPT